MKTGAIVENLLGRGWELSWALKNGQDLDKFRTWTKLTRMGTWCVWGTMRRLS